MLKLLTLSLISTSPALGWWCEGHEVVALIAGNHLEPKARASVLALLSANPPDNSIQRFCANGPEDPIAIASTWADDVKRTELTARWHYMDIPLGLKRGDPEAYCEPVGPSENGKERSGCILSALRYSVNILHDPKETGFEKANALRYLIHLVGDLHQPMHTTSNNDQGGNCTPVQFLSDAKIANLHSVWDGLILNRDLTAKHQSLIEIAAELDGRYQSKIGSWTRHGLQFDKWAWEGHQIAQKVAYGDLKPSPPVEPYNPHPDCQLESEKFGALHIQVGEEYENDASPVVEEQLAKAGYRLAEILNDIWP